MFSWRLTVFFEIQVWKIFIRLEHQFFYFKPEINQTYLTYTLKVLKFCGYLISQLEKKLRFASILAIWWVQNIFRGTWFHDFSKNKKRKLIIVNQCNCYQTCYRNSNFLTISRDMRYTSIIILIWLNIRKKRISNSAGL